MLKLSKYNHFKFLLQNDNHSLSFYKRSRSRIHFALKFHYPVIPELVSFFLEFDEFL